MKGGAIAAILALLLAGCTECDCDSEEQALEQGTESNQAASPDNRLRGPATLQPRDAGDDEHPHPLYPRVLQESGKDAAGHMRLRRDFPRTITTPVRYGLLHAHTWYSDGTGTPEDAFTRAAQMGLDFLAVTPHNHNRAEMGARDARRDKVLIANDHDLFSADGDVTFTREFRVNGVDHTETLSSPSVVNAAEQSSTSDFVGIVGQEFSSISSGNHVNVLGWNEVITVANGDFAGLFNSFDNQTPVLQMNHPNFHLDLFYGGSMSSTIGRMFNDYGFDDHGEDFETLIAASDHLIVLLEVLTGPAFAQTAHASFHYDDHERDYYYYLVQGYHISPSVGHDNHFRTWGDATPARMGVFSDTLSRDALLAAMRANKTFATEDTDLRLDFLINGSGMGDVIDVAEGTTLSPRLIITDPTDGGSEYTVDLFYGDVQPQDRNTLYKWVPADGLTESFSFIGDGQLDFDEYVASGVPEFFYVRVRQGDGDRAWTSPIWINHPRGYDVGGGTTDP